MQICNLEEWSKSTFLLASVMRGWESSIWANLIANSLCRLKTQIYDQGVSVYKLWAWADCIFCNLMNVPVCINRSVSCPWNNALHSFFFLLWKYAKNQTPTPNSYFFMSRGVTLSFRDLWHTSYHFTTNKIMPNIFFANIGGFGYEIPALPQTLC